MNRWKYFIGPGLFRESSTLCLSLDAALLACGPHDYVGLIARGHAPYRSTAYPDRPADPLTHIHGWVWRVVQVHDFRDGEKPLEKHLGEFGSHLDAFAFAELKTATAKARGDKWESFSVCLHAHTERGVRPEIARLPAEHLAKLRRARDRDQRSAQKNRYSHAA